MKPDDSSYCELCIYRADQRCCEECIEHSRFVSIDEMDDWQDDWDDEEEQTEDETNEN